MALTKAEVRDALRESILAEYADVPPAEEIDHVFSDRFLAFMAALIEEEKRGSWRLLSRKSRRALVVAAILAVSMLLVACTPTWREAVSEFIVTVYERFVGYRVQTELHEKLDTIYMLDPIPEGFELVSQTQHSPQFVETLYQNRHGEIIQLSQSTVQDMSAMADNERGEVLVIEKDSRSYFIYSSESLATVSWVFDGYYMEILYMGQIDNTQLVSLTETISPVE